MVPYKHYHGALTEASILHRAQNSPNLGSNLINILAAVLGLGLDKRDLVTWRRDLELTSLAWRHLPFTLAYSEQVAGAGNVVFTPE